MGGFFGGGGTNSGGGGGGSSGVIVVARDFQGGMVIPTNALTTLATLTLPALANNESFRGTCFIDWHTTAVAEYITLSATLTDDNAASVTASNSCLGYDPTGSPVGGGAFDFWFQNQASNGQVFANLFTRQPTYQASSQPIIPGQVWGATNSTVLDVANGFTLTLTIDTRPTSGNFYGLYYSTMVELMNKV